MLPKADFRQATAESKFVGYFQGDECYEDVIIRLSAVIDLESTKLVDS